VLKLGPNKNQFPKTCWI